MSRSLPASLSRVRLTRAPIFLGHPDHVDGSVSRSVCTVPVSLGGHTYNALGKGPRIHDRAEYPIGAPMIRSSEVLLCYKVKGGEAFAIVQADTDRARYLAVGARVSGDGVYCDDCTYVTSRSWSAE